MSSPSVEGAPPFLTSLPPEMRNMVYEVLFRLGKPVLIHNRAAFHARLPTKSNRNRGEALASSVADFNRCYDAEIGSDAEFYHGFDLGLPLLRSCRQIYQQAIGVLYGSNTFMVTRVLDQHDYDSDELHSFRRPIFEREPETGGYDQVTYAPRWLSQLGSALFLLNKVQINVSASCQHPCDYSRGRIDILPYMQLLSKRRDSKPWLELTDAGRPLTVCTFEDVSPTEPPLFVPEMFNQILSALTEQDVLRVKRFRDPGRILRLVYLEPRNLWEDFWLCRVFHKVTNASLDCHMTVLRSSGPLGDPKFSERPDYKVPLGLDTLRFEVWRKILGFVVGSPTGVVFDLDTRKVHSLDPQIIGVDRWIRKHRGRAAPEMIAATNTVTVRASATSSTTSFNDFDALGQELITPSHMLPGSTIAEIIPKSSEHNTLSIELTILLPEPTTLDAIRIDIKGLMRCNDFAKNDRISTPTIRLTINSPTGGKDVTLISLPDLQRHVFLLLSTLLLEWPNTFSPKITRTLPSIWINGHGRLIEATYPDAGNGTSHTQAYEHRHLRKQDIGAQRAWRQRR